METLACFGPDPVPEPADAPGAAFRVPREVELLTAGAGPGSAGSVLVVGFVVEADFVVLVGFVVAVDFVVEVRVVLVAAFAEAFVGVAFSGAAVVPSVTGATFAAALAAVLLAAVRDELVALVASVAAVVDLLAAPRVGAFAAADLPVEGPPADLRASDSESMAARRAASAARVAAGSGSNVRVRAPGAVDAGWFEESARARARADPGIGRRGSSRSWITGATMRITSSSLAEASGSRRTP